ncbi:MAG: AAA family ATPase, partial [Gemmataceae bacterium]
ITIAISREAGSGGSNIAKELSRRLGWPLYDHELLTRISEEKGLHQKLVERLDERAMNWLEEVVESFSSSPTTSERTYLKGLLEILAGLARVGHCIIVGRGGAQILPPETTLRVRVVAPLPQRVAKIEESMHFNHDQAAKWVEHTDRDRKKFIERHFQTNPSDPLGYDLVLNTERLSMEECAAIIIKAAETMEARVKKA